MTTMKVRLSFFEPILGTSPQNEDIYREYIGSKSPDAASIEEEVRTLGVDSVVEKGMTVFHKNDGVPFFYDYQIKGFFKDSCGGLREDKSTKSSKLTAYKKKIDKLIFVMERTIPIKFEGEIGVCQRPLRAQTMQGERVSLAISEEIPTGASCEFTIACFVKEHMDLVKEWLDYGRWSGMGQWRNSGKGRFTWEKIEEGEE